MRRVLDGMYLGAGWLAGLCIVAICLLITAQIGFNIAARLGGAGWTYTIPSYADFSGYLLSTASFMALAHTLRAGAHIRVGLVVQRLPQGLRWIVELLTLGAATAFSVFATFYAARLMEESWRYGDKSTGIVAIPIWMPQGFMVLGLGLLTVAFIDTLIQSLRSRLPILTDAGAE